MGSWRIVLAGVAVLLPAAVMGSTRASPWIVLPPVAMAALVLFVAALSVDYFGLARKRHGWGGLGSDPRRAWMRARALEQRFGAQKRRGSPRTAWTARSLLVALAECDRLDDAQAVVDFLGADAVYGRVGGDSTADALRAVALAQLGRVDEARELCESLREHRAARASPVVGYASARVAELDRRPQEALDFIAQALGSRALLPAARRDLLIVRARVLAGQLKSHDAARVLGEVAAMGWRREVEQVAERAATRGNAALSLAAREALSEAIPYR